MLYNKKFFIINFGRCDYKGITSYAKEAVIWALNKGVIKGQGGTNIAPADNALRCEIAQIMYNIYLNDIFVYIVNNGRG